LEKVAKLAGESFGARVVSSFGGSLISAVPPLLPQVVMGLARSTPDHVAFFGQARQGLFVLVQHLLHERDTRVFVVPAYTCPTVPQAVEQAGGRCVFVDVDDALDFDWADLTEQVATVDPADVVLLATSLFGAPVRDYKQLMPAAVVVEDRSQSVYERNSQADYQILSFGPGKLLSLGGGGALVGRHLNFKLDQWPTQSAWRLPLMITRTFVQDQVFKHRWTYRLVAPLLPHLLKNSGHNDAIRPVRMHPWQARWAWFAMRRVKLDQRTQLGLQWKALLPKEMQFGVAEPTPWLRLPIKLSPAPSGLMLGTMYQDTVEKAQKDRQCVLQGAQKLVGGAFLPVHETVAMEWMVAVARLLAH